MLGITACSGLLCDAKESERVPSPEGAYGAVVVTTNCGATTSLAYSIHLVRAGASPSKGDGIFLADKVENLRIRWVNPKTLSITYREAQIGFFTNFWDVRIGDRVDRVHVRESLES